MSRIPFSAIELDYLDRLNPKLPGNKDSYQAIARALNEIDPEHNQKCRTRDIVRGYYVNKRKRAEAEIRMISLPRAISKQLSKTQISRILVSYCENKSEKAGVSKIDS